MIKVIINGCNGAMGRVLTEIIGQEPSMEIVAGVDRDTEAKSGYPVYDSLAQCPKADVIIDFSVAKAADGLISYCEETKIPLVLCTTGLSEDQLLRVNKLSETSAVLRSANMSVGINLLREGLDIPEITLVAILDADKEGFLRSETSLIQTIGRAARNSEGHVIMYADNMTDSMRNAIEETSRRRELQQAYNEAHGITPKTIQKAVRDLISISKEVAKTENTLEKDPESMSREELEKLIGQVQKQMKAAAADLNFEMAAELRDKMIELKKSLDDLKEM